MDLSFKVNFPWKGATNFIAKILASLPGVYSWDTDTPKIHTIREDPSDRWKKGRLIQFVTGARTKKRQVHGRAVCKSVQKIEIIWIGAINGRTMERAKTMCVYIDGKQFGNFDELAANDGFNSVKDFQRWFHKDFEGKIIHWTDKRY